MSQPSPPAPGAGLPAFGAEPSARAEQILSQAWPVLADAVLPRMPEVFQAAVSAAARSEDEAVARNAAALLAHEKAVLQAFSVGLRGAFDLGVERFWGRKVTPTIRRATLSLLEMDESDQRSQVDQVTARVRNLLQASQAALLARLQTLGSGLEIAETQSPLRPGIFLQAIADGLAPFITSSGGFGGVLRQFAVPLAPAIEAGYLAVIQHFERNGISPVPLARAGASRGTPLLLSIADDERAPAGEPGRDDVAGATPAARLAAGARPAVAPPAAVPEVAPVPGDEPALIEYVRLQALLGINANVLLDAAAVAAGRPGAVAAPATVPAAPAPALVAFMLSAQRRDAARVAAKPEENAARARPADAAGGADAAPADPATPPAPGAVEDMVSTRDHSRHLIGLATSPLQKLTIQLVARLFARIERDRLVPEPLRTMLVCLRFPALEVALADPAMLVRANHPVRRLLDAIGSSAIGWAPDGAESRRYLHHARAAVHFVVHSPGTAAAAFAQSAEQFDAFLASVVPTPSEAMTQAKDALREADRRELQAREVSHFLDELLQGAALEEYLQQFLTVVWARVLVEGAAREAEEPGGFGRLANVIPELVASVQSPSAAADRRRLVETIPGLLGQLRDGVALIGWPPEKMQAFLNRLMIAHSQVITGTEQPAPSPTAFSASTVRIRLDGLRLAEPAAVEREGPVPVLEEAVHHVLQQRGATAIHQWLKNAPVVPPGALSEFEASAQVAHWKERTWFDMRLGRTLVRMRLAWCTPSRSLALFASRSGSSLVSMSHASLITYRRCGWIAPAEPLALTARALRSVLVDLQRAVEAAASGNGDGA